MEVETTFNILNNRLSLQNEYNPISCSQELPVWHNFCNIVRLKNNWTRKEDGTYDTQENSD